VAEEIKIEYDIANSVHEMEILKAPRCIKSHLPLQLLPKQLWTIRPKVNLKVLRHVTFVGDISGGAVSNEHNFTSR
jgi:hypothetical protein